MEEDFGGRWAVDFVEPSEPPGLNGAEGGSDQDIGWCGDLVGLSIVYLRCACCSCVFVCEDGVVCVLDCLLCIIWCVGLVIVGGKGVSGGGRCGHSRLYLLCVTVGESLLCSRL